MFMVARSAVNEPKLWRCPGLGLAESAELRSTCGGKGAADPTSVADEVDRKRPLYRLDRVPGSEDSEAASPASVDGHCMLLLTSEADAGDDVDRTDPVRCAVTGGASTPSGRQWRSSASETTGLAPTAMRPSMPELPRELVVETELRRLLPPIASAPHESQPDDAAVPADPVEVVEASVVCSTLVRCLTVPPSVVLAFTLLVLPAGAATRSDELFGTLEENREKAVQESKLRRRSDLGGDALTSGDSLPEAVSTARREGEPTTRTWT